MKEKGRFLKKYRGEECLNCSAPLDIIDKYCHNCGQINTTKKISLKDFFGEFFSTLFSYDSRLAHTVNALLFSPGKISKEYIEGKRIKYANPFRFYLSVSLLFFIINGFFIDFDSFTSRVKNDVQVSKKESSKAIDSLKQDLQEELTTTQDSSTVFITDLLSLVSMDIEKKKEVVYYSQEQIDNTSFSQTGFKLWPMYEDYYNRTGETSTYNALTKLEHKTNWINKYIYNRILKTQNLKNNYGIELLEFLFNKLPFIIFFFLPFFALAIWLLYIRKPYNYMEHLVFTFHTQTMFFILLGIASLINQITTNYTSYKAAILIFLFYLCLAIYKFYQQSWGKTIVKFLLVNILFFILAVLGSFITIIGSIFIF